MVRADVYVRLTGALEIADQRPRMRDGCEVKIFRLRWGNDYAMLARDDRELHYRLEVWEAELLPKIDVEGHADLDTELEELTKQESSVS